MADIDLQRLIVSLEASFTKYERAWQRAQGITDTGTRALTRQFDTISARAASAGSGAAAGLRPVSIQTANIAAQFQDIAVQLQSGQSPLTIALQQGTQLSAALGTGQGLRGVLGALAGGFTALLNPVSLVTIATIALGGAAVQYFATLINDGRVSEETLKKQNDLIHDIASKWGEVVPALKEYVEKLDATENATKASEAQAALVGRAWQESRDSVRQFQIDIASLMEDLMAVGAPEAGVLELQRAFGDLNAKVKDGTATVEDANRVTAALSDLMTTVHVPALQQVANGWGAVVDQIAHANSEAAKFTPLSDVPNLQGQALQKFIDDQDRLNGLTQDQLDLENEIARVKAEAERAAPNAALSDEEALRIAKERLAAEEKRRQAAISARSEDRGGDQAAREAQREAEGVLDLISALTFEHETMGVNAEDLAVLNALRRAGSAATSDQLVQIENLVRANYEETEALEKSKEAMDAVKDAAKESLSTFIGDLRQGKSAAEALGDVFDKLADKLIDIAVNNLVEAAFGGLTGGSAGSGIGSFLTSLFGGARAAGGPVEAGKAYVVGEKRPELFVPNQSGVIVPRLPGAIAPTQAAASSMMGPTINVSITGSERDAAAIAREVVPVIRRQIPDMIAASNRNPYRRTA